MKGNRLACEDIWRVLKALSPVERRMLRARLRGTRLGWLVEVLLKMNDYSEERLKDAYKTSFPRQDLRLLRVYKHQLWQILEDTLPTRENPTVGREVRIWQRLWLSVILWERGLPDIAELTWHRSMSEAAKIGWYEVVLWGISILEVFERDLRKVAGRESLHEYVIKIIDMIKLRYDSLYSKARALEIYKPSTPSSQIILPSLPAQDEWSLYM